MTKEELLQEADRAMQEGDEQRERDFRIKALMIEDQPDPSLPESKQPSDGPTGYGILDGYFQFMNDAQAGGKQRLDEALAGLAFVEDEKYFKRRMEKLKAQEQDLEHRGVGKHVGGIGTDMLLTAPALMSGGPSFLSALGRTLGIAGIESATHPGDLETRATIGAASIPGALIGETAAKTLSTALHPFAKRPQEMMDRTVRDAERMGLKPDAAQVSRNPVLQVTDSVLDQVGPSAGSQMARKDAQARKWYDIIVKETGYADDVSDLTPEIMNKIDRDMRRRYSALHARNQMTIDGSLLQNTERLRTRYGRNLQSDQMTEINNILNEIMNLNLGAKIPGETYQLWRSKIGERLRSFRSVHRDNYDTALGVKKALDDAYERSISPEDFRALKKENYQKLVFETIKESVDKVSLRIAPAKFMEAVANRDTLNEIGVLGRGPQKLTKLARIGKQMIAPNLRDSYTSFRTGVRNAVQHPLGRIATGVGAGVGTAAASPIADSLIGNAIEAGIGLGSAKLLSNAMAKPHGYLAEGLMDMQKPVIGNMNREGLLTALGRHAGAATGSEIAKPSYRKKRSR